MRVFLTILLATFLSADRVKFGKDSSTLKIYKVNPRLGLLGKSLGLSPIGEKGGQSNGQSGTLTQDSTQNNVRSPTGRVPNGGELSGTVDNCCCVPLSTQCGDPLGNELEDDLVGLGLIDPRQSQNQKSKLRQGITTRIVNRPSPTNNFQQNTCPVGQKACCYESSVDHSLFGRTCTSPGQTQNQETIRYGCDENIVSSSGKQCGTRNYLRPASNLNHGESSPGEFPWTCLILNGNNDFIGSCAIIPGNNGQATNRVVTAAHKLKDVQLKELLKIRVGEYDASGFNPPETVNHDEYTVVRFLKHPQMGSGRLDYDIAILYTQEPINLNKPNVNSACLPSCRDQFSHTFQNGTGTRCWVAGWGKNEIDGSFQFIQHKVDLPLVNDQACEQSLKGALNRQRAGTGNRFRLSPSEICAGGQIGKDACTGDGGSPLVCQAQSGRWTVVGLVTWGVGCASDVPGVYARMSHFSQWLNDN